MIYDLELDAGVGYPPTRLAGLAQMAEAAGFGAIWKGEVNSQDPLVTLAALAAQTRTIGLGTAIYHIWARSPVSLGIQAATLQDLSGGRLLLGLGVANRVVAGWHGAAFDAPLGRTREYVDIVRRVARGERLGESGRYYPTGERFKLSWQPEHPEVPVFLAALGPRMTDLAGALTSGVILNMLLPDKVRALAARVRAAAAAGGRAPEAVAVAAKVRVCVHPDRTRARAGLRQALTFYHLAAFYSDRLREMGFGAEVDAVHDAFKQGGFKAAAAAISDEYIDRLPVIAATSVGEVRERLQPYPAAGATRLIIPYAPVGDDVAADLATFLQQWGAGA